VSVTYRLFCLDGQGKILHARTLDAHDDAEAVRLAHAVPRDAVTCEIWDVDRLVTKFDGRNGGEIQPR